jgi:hypothetical protein
VNASIKPPQLAMDTGREAESTDSRWRALYRLAGAGALISAVFIPIQALVFIVWPPPLDGGAADWLPCSATTGWWGSSTWISC